MSEFVDDVDDLPPLGHGNHLPGMDGYSHLPGVGLGEPNDAVEAAIMAVAPGSPIRSKRQSHGGSEKRPNCTYAGCSKQVRLQLLIDQMA